MQGKVQFRNLSFGAVSRTAVFALSMSVVPLLIAVVAQPASAQTFSVIYNFTGGVDGAAPQAGLTIDRAGDLYGTAYQGGASSRGTVFKLTRRGTGWTFNTLYSFAGKPDAASPLSRVIPGPEGTFYGTTEFGGRNCGLGTGCGTVYKLQPRPTPCKSAICPWLETVLYEFAGDADGANPAYGDLVLDQAGNIYGTTFYGGINAQGVVFELTPSGSGWTETPIYTFTGADDGANPYSGLIFDSAGNLYGTTNVAGANGYGTVFQLTHSGSGWAENTLYAFHPASSGGSPYGGLAFDTSGNLYGGTSSGGTGSGGTIYELTTSGDGYTFSLLYSLSGSQYQPGPYDSLTLDAAGNLYGTTQKDGAHGMGSVFKLTRSGGGWLYTSLHDFTGGSDGANPVGGVILDASGNLYGTAKAGGASGNGVVWEITP